MNDLLLALDLWVGFEFWLPAAVLILVSLMVVGSPTAQLRSIALCAVFVVITIFAVLAQQWLIALAAICYPWVIIRDLQKKSDLPVHIVRLSAPRPLRAIALISAAMFVGIWVLAVKRTIVWRYAESPVTSSLSDVIAALPSHALTLSLFAVGLVLSVKKTSIHESDSSRHHAGTSEEAL